MDDKEEGPMAAQHRSKRRRATLYDATAGRVNYKGFMPDPAASRYRDTADTSTYAVPPDEVLFRRKNAPLRFAENDIYRAERHLPADQPLPDTDLLKSIHAYCSHFYAKTSEDGGKEDYCSMDETALLAMAILLEGAASHAIGETGDLALVQTSVRRPPALQRLPAVRSASSGGKRRQNSRVETQIKREPTSP